MTLLQLNKKISAKAFQALWDLHDSNIITIPITGRPAGWCDLIVHEWPVAGVIGENGAFAFWEDSGQLKRIYHKNAVYNDNAILKKIESRVLKEVPGSRIAGDQFGRMFDLAIDFAEEQPKLPLSSAIKIKEICDSEGAISKISSIHVNTWLGAYSKLEMTIEFLKMYFGYDDTMNDSIIFFGDSPNDEPMFSHFNFSIGVANILRYKHLIKDFPKYITKQTEGDGFAEGINKILSLRTLTKSK